MDTNALPRDEQRLVLRLLHYWRELAGNRTMPDLDEIDGAAIADMWPCCFMLDYADPDGLSFRYVGQRHIADLTFDPTGRSITDVREDILLGRAACYGTQVLDQKVPITLGGKFFDGAGRTILYRSILLPVSHGDSLALLGGANSRVIVLD